MIKGGKMKGRRSKPHGEQIGWEVLVRYGSFTVELLYANKVKRAYTYQFNDMDGVFDGMDKLRKHDVSKQILQEVFDELLHAEILSELLTEERYKKTGSLADTYERSRIANLQRVEKENTVEG